MRIKRWIISEVADEKVREIAEKTGIPELVSRVMVARNPNSTPQEIENFLRDELEFESPFNIKDMDKAVQRITTAIEEGQRIAIYGDYDCDGITATAVMLNYFQSVGADAFFYIPNREEEGYGMNTAAIDKIAEKGAQLIVTVDNGITSHDEIDYAAKLGIDVVVTDHHIPRETLPNAVAVINPHRSDCTSRFKDYAGVGVAFQLVCALEDASPEELLEYYSDLVAIGTVADMVPLHNENRVIVRHGIEMLESTHRAGLRALMDSARLSPPLSSESVSFGISPRINAAGRMGSADEAVELILTDDDERAVAIAEALGAYNLQRRGVEEVVLKEISDMLKASPQKLLDRVLIIWGEGWHQGVMGIVASRLLERYGKPTIVFSITDGVAKGSGRSLEGFSLIDAVTQSSQHLTHYGGHTLAAGMTILEEHLESFSKQIQQHAKENYKIMPVPSYHVDCLLGSAELTVKNIQSLGILAPFGAGNAAPIFILKKLKLEGIYPTADEKHMRLKFSDNGKEINTIYFRMTTSRFPYEEGDVLDVVADVDLNDWNGNLQLSIKIKDLRPSEYPEQKGIEASQRYLCHRRGEYGENCRKEDIIPSREEFEMVYRYLKSRGEFVFGPVALWEMLIDKDMDLARLQVILDVFRERELISKDKGKIAVLPQHKKVDLQLSKILIDLNA